MLILMGVQVYRLAAAVSVGLKPDRQSEYICGGGRHGRGHGFNDDGGRVQCPGLVVYKGDRERYDLLSMWVNLVSAGDTREPGDVYRGESTEVD
jgi:hypothetical protein